MISENMKPQEFQMTNHLMELVKDVRKSYFLHLKEKAMKKLKTDAEEKQEKINNKIKDTNCQIRLLEETVAKLKADGDKYLFEVEKKTSLVEIKATLLTSNTLKRAAFEKQELIDKLSAKKRCWIEKRLIFKFATILNSLSEPWSFLRGFYIIKSNSKKLFLTSLQYLKTVYEGLLETFIIWFEVLQWGVK